LRVCQICLSALFLLPQDGFAPYFQHKLLPRLKRHVRPGGWLFFVGTEPLPEKCETRAQQLIADVARTRDAAILLGQDRKRVYREYPLEVRLVAYRIALLICAPQVGAGALGAGGVSGGGCGQL
jgi:hypothetical protein